MNIFVFDPIGEKEPEEIEREKRREAMLSRFYPLYREVNFSMLPVGMEFSFRGVQYNKITSTDFELASVVSSSVLNSSDLKELSQCSRGSFPDGKSVFIKESNFQMLNI